MIFWPYPYYKPTPSETVLCIQKLTDGEDTHYRYITAFHVEEEGFYTVDNEEGVPDVTHFTQFPVVPEDMSDKSTTRLFTHPPLLL